MVDFHGKYSSYVIYPGERRYRLAEQVEAVPLSLVAREMMEGTEG